MQLEKVINEKVDAAFQALEPHKKFFITENGRGVVDGGDLYNAILTDMNKVIKSVLIDLMSNADKDEKPARRNNSEK